MFNGYVPKFIDYLQKKRKEEDERQELRAETISKWLLKYAESVSSGNRSNLGSKTEKNGENER